MNDGPVIRLGSTAWGPSSELAHAHEHAGDFPRAATRRALRRDPSRAAVLLTVTPRYGGGFDYRLQPLLFRPNARMLMDYLDELPFGSTLSVHTRAGARVAPRRAKLEAV